MEKSKKSCAGCYSNDYNFGLGGSKECWSYESAKIIARLPIPVDKRPPYDKSEAIPMMSCFNKKKMCYVNPDVIRDDGYWR